METMAAAGFGAYKSLVHDDPDFLTFWKQATPIDEISNLKLGSRPTFRRATQSVEDLRAIPWVFSWMQSRFVFPGWFGLGTALTHLVDLRTWILFPDISRNEAARTFGAGVALQLRFG